MVAENFKISRDEIAKIDHPWLEKIGTKETRFRLYLMMTNTCEKLPDFQPFQAKTEKDVIFQPFQPCQP